MILTLSPTTRLLFIGDSITDCGRSTDPDGLGQGYVRLTRDYLQCKDPANSPIVINRGISGNKVVDLAPRWEADVLAESPDILSIKIGINDVWHGLAGGPGVPIDQFQTVYRDLLRQVKATLPECKLVLCEPSVIWRPAGDGIALLQPYVRAVGELAREFGAEYIVPLHRAFVRAREIRPDLEWALDGVHPSSAGHMLIARTWLSATGLL